MPEDTSRPVKPFRDPRGTRAFYEGRLTVYAAGHLMTREQARRDPTFRQAWQEYREILYLENQQNHAARDFVLAERYRARLEEGDMNASRDYVLAIREGYDMTTRDGRRQSHSRIVHPLTRAEYEQVVALTTVDHSPQGRFARILQILGLRTPAATWDVGQTP